MAARLAVALAMSALAHAHWHAAAAAPRRLLIDGAVISEPEAPGVPVLLRGFNLDFKLGGGYPLPIAQDKALGALLPGTNLVRLVMNHWHDTAAASDCATQSGPSFLSAQCLAQFDETLAWSTGELGAWSIITARSALASSRRFGRRGLVRVRPCMRAWPRKLGSSGLGL